MPLLREQDKREIKKQLAKLNAPVTIHTFKENLSCDTCHAAETLMEEIAGLSDQLTLKITNRLVDEKAAAKYGVDKVPAIVLEGASGARVRFFGIPSGYEFVSFLEALKDASAGTSDLSAGSRKKLDRLKDKIHIQVFVTPTCPYCPPAVRAAHKLAVASPHVVADMVEAQEFPDLVRRYRVRGVPKIVINDKVELDGAVPEDVLTEAVLAATA